MDIKLQETGLKLSLKNIPTTLPGQLLVTYITSTENLTQNKL